jgi:omega-amidase
MRFQRAALLFTSAISIAKPSSSLALSSFHLTTSTRTAFAKNSLSTTSTTSLPYTLAYTHTRTRTRNNILTSRNMSTTSSESTKINGGKVALLQFEVSPNKEKNQQKVTELIETTMAQNPNTQLIVLPEIWNGPYATAAFAEYAEILPSIGYKYDHDDNNYDCPSAKILFEAAIKHNVYIIGGSISEKKDDKIYNTCLCISPNGTLVAKHRKVHLFDIDVKGGITFKESDTLTGGDTVSVFDTGDDLFGNIGVGICYDIRFPEYALLLRQKYGCNLLVYPGAFNLTTGPAHWELLQRGRAVDNQCFVLTASPARVDPPKETTTESATSKYPHYSAWGHSTIVNPWGEVVATCDEKENVVVADLNMEEVKNMRQGIPTFTQKRTDLYNLVDVEGNGDAH